MIDPSIRKLGIGGSDVAAIFGADEFKDAFSVWAMKKGGLVADPRPNIRMLVGKCLEEGVLKIYEHVTGRKIEYLDTTLQHLDRPWQVYSVDALCVNERRGVDAKVVAWDQRRQWGESADEIPMRVQLQCWWYMSALNYDVWDVCALMGEGVPRIYTIERDLEAERAMLARVEEWYVRYIVGDERPPLGGNADAARWLKQMYPVHKRPDLRWASDDEVRALQEYVKVRVEQKELARRRAALEIFLKSSIAEREGLEWDEGRFTWRRTKDGTWVDWESMALALLHSFIKPESRAEVEAQYTHVKEGVRRIYCDHDDLRNKPEAEEAAVA
jgi:predicted phage-related endonuclease